MSLLPKESEVEEKMREHLRDLDFEVKERTATHGVDIAASINGRDHYIEVEGNTKPDGGPLTSSQKYTHLLRAVGQLCLRLHDNPDAALGLALPEDEYYRNKVDKLQTALKRLNVTVYFVDSDGRVEKRVCGQDTLRCSQTVT